MKRYFRGPEVVEAVRWFPGIEVEGVEPHPNPDNRPNFNEHIFKTGTSTEWVYIQPGDFVVQFDDNLRGVLSADKFNSIYKPL